ncbi:sensor histidine kinase [Nocardia uniformis]|uniref:histidine kinase n=1 Tax=Nocardia uniformis TaxID=53432 RepID=A0A849C443_9NOCA|nr:sensor histidine kinase [Nocardia uniformis]
MRQRIRALPSAVLYLVIGGATSLVALFAMVGLCVAGALSLVGVGLPILPDAVRALRPLLGFERRRAAGRLGAPIVEAYRPLTGSLRQQVSTVFADPANRRDVVWLTVHAGTGLILGALAFALPLSAINQALIPLYWQLVPEGAVDNFGISVRSWSGALLAMVLAIPVGALALQVPVMARWQARVARWLLAPPADVALADRVAELTATRAAALDAHGAELRRIERDLHDGAQARMAAVIMQLGLAEQLHDRDPAAARDLMRKAQDTATDALAELREVLRSVYPPVLSDRGLASALSGLAARSPIPCTLEASTIGRWPAAVEAAAYFVVAEALTNATKHSRAHSIAVSVRGADNLLTVEIRDDGIGEAREADGGGLAGIRRRAEALDGRMTLASPAGGPTVLRVELPSGL